MGTPSRHRDASCRADRHRPSAAANEAGRAYLLGCPGGRSAMPVHEALAKRSSPPRRIDCSSLTIAAMDEYLLAGDRTAHSPPPASARIPTAVPASARSSGRINAGLPEASRISAEISGCPAVAPAGLRHAPRADAGGIDLFLARVRSAATAAIAFSPPGSAREQPQPHRPSSPNRPAATTSRTCPTSSRSTRCPPMASPSVSPPSPRCQGRRHRSCARRRQAHRLPPHRRGQVLRSSWPATIVVECSQAELHADRAAAYG